MNKQIRAEIKTLEKKKRDEVKALNQYKSKLQKDIKELGRLMAGAERTTIKRTTKASRRLGILRGRLS